MKYILDNTIVLTRSDLQRDKQNKVMAFITCYDFRPSILSREMINKYENIIFCDTDYSTKTLKSKV